MNITFNVVEADLLALGVGITASIEAVRPKVNEAMGQRFYELVQGNFGIAGVDRPMAWAPLSPAYAKSVGRQIATLDLTGALRSAIMVGGNMGQGITVSVSNSSVPYATIHQTGGLRMPARPYFPIDENGEVLPYTVSQIVEVVAKTLREN